MKKYYVLFGYDSCGMKIDELTYGSTFKELDRKDTPYTDEEIMNVLETMDKKFESVTVTTMYELLPLVDRLQSTKSNDEKNEIMEKHKKQHSK